MTLLIVEKIIEMLILIFMGMLVYKIGLMDDHTASKLSSFLLSFIQPLVIISSYQKEFQIELLYGLLLALLASALSYLITIAASHFLLMGDHPDRAIEKLAVVYSNCGFFSLPLVNSILGSDGVFYLTMYITMYNLLFWTHGISLISGSSKAHLSWKSLLQKNLTPVNISILIGILFFVARIRLPEILLSPVQMVANMNTPIAMIIAGVNLAKSGILKCFTKKRIYLICAFRLLLFPAATILLLYGLGKVIDLSFPVSYAVFMGAAAPSGANAIMLADRYQRDTAYATQIFVATTVLCSLTIPLLSTLAGAVLQ